MLEEEVPLAQEERKEESDIMATRENLVHKECMVLLDRKEKMEERENVATQDTKDRRGRPEVLAHKVLLDHKGELDLGVLLLLLHRTDATGSILTPVDICVVYMSRREPHALLDSMWLVLVFIRGIAMVVTIPTSCVVLYVKYYSTLIRTLYTVWFVHMTQ